MCRTASICKKMNIVSLCLFALAHRLGYPAFSLQWCLAVSKSRRSKLALAFVVCIANLLTQQPWVAHSSCPGALAPSHNSPLISSMFGITERQRDLFPLPLGVNHYKCIRQHNPQGISMSRHIKCKWGKKSFNVDWMNEGINTLNELSGVPFSAPPSTCQKTFTEQLLGAFRTSLHSGSSSSRRPIPRKRLY